MANTSIINALELNGNIYPFTLISGSCSTAAGTAEKTVTVSNEKFALAAGARIAVKFTVTNTAASPTLNVNGTGAKAIYYNGAAITAGYLKANKIYEFLYNGERWELIGDLDSAAVQLAYDKIISRGEQLIVNGNGLMGNNTNFSRWVFDGKETNNSAGSFTYSTPGVNPILETDEFFPVNPQSTYALSIDAKSKNGLGTMYSFLSFYDIDKNPIKASNHMFVTGSTTTLAQDLKAGDTVVRLTSVAGFSTTKKSSNFLAIWNYKNSFGYVYPKETYTRNSYKLTASNYYPTNIDTTNNTVTLATAYEGETIPAGTLVSQGMDGAAYKYCAMDNIIVPTTWSTFKGKISGVDLSGTNVGRTFPPGTAYAKLGFLWNYNKANDFLWITNLSVTDIGDNTIYTLTKSGNNITLTGSDGSTTSIIDSDTAYTAGSSNTSSKIFLIGTTEQTENGRTTFSHDTAYVGHDGYLYSNSEKVNPRIYASLIPTGSAIPANADLNTVEYLKVGSYYCQENNTVKTLKNCPLTTYGSNGVGTSGSAFMMQVYSPLSTYIDNETTSTWVVRIRKITHYYTGVEYTQYCSVDDTAGAANWFYGNWYITPRSRFTFNKTDASTAAVGSATQPVYVSSNGSLTACSYVLGKSVPSDAKFTDTTYTNESLGQGYAICSTAAATRAKVASLSGYSLVKGGVVSVKFSDNLFAEGETTLTATLNVNSKGAKNIYYNGSTTLPANLIQKNDIVTFIYDGTQYQLIAVDRWGKAIEELNNTTSNLSQVKLDAAPANEHFDAIDKDIDYLKVEVTKHPDAYDTIKIGDTLIEAEADNRAISLAAGANIMLTPDTVNKTVTITAIDSTKVEQVQTDVAGEFPLLAGSDGQNASTLDVVHFNNAVTMNPSTKTINANINGNVTANRIDVNNIFNMLGYQIDIDDAGNVNCEYIGG